MIRGNSYMNAIGVAGEFAAKGKGLMAIPGTLLSELVGKSTLSPTELMRMASGVDAVQNYGIMLSVLTDDSNIPSPHSASLGAFVDDISKPVAMHTNFAKNVVKPLVIELAEQLQQRSQDLKTVTPGSDIKFTVRDIPEILENSSFLDTLKFYKSSNFSEPKSNLKLGGRSNDEIRDLMLTGDKRTDEQIVAWLTQQAPNFPRDVWSVYFNTTDAALNESIVDGNNAFAMVDRYLGVYLIARRIIDDVQTSDTSLSTYKNMCADIRDYAGSMLVSALSKLKRMVEDNTLVVFASPRFREIIVNGPIYNDWLSKGGKPEIILGMLVGNKVSTTVEMIDEKAKQHEQSWNAYVTLETARNNNQFFERFKTAILETFEKHLVKQDSSEEEMNLVNAQRLVNVSLKAKEYIDTLSLEDLKRIYDIALTLVAKIRFSHTSSYQILFDIQQAYLANENVDIREAVLLANINYLADWLADQITFTK